MYLQSDRVGDAKIKALVTSLISALKANYAEPPAVLFCDLDKLIHSLKKK